MFKVLFILWCSVGIGLLLRRHPQLWIGQVTTYCVWVLLFLIGAEVGANNELIHSLGKLGVEAFLIALFSSTGCGLLALFLWKWNKKDNKAVHKKPLHHTLSVGMQCKESALIIGFFLLGGMGGYLNALSFIPQKASFYTLCLLLACVGFGVGQNSQIRRNLRTLNKRLMLLPLVTILGTWVGTTFTALVLNERSLTDYLAISSGFGYYSLSSILITEARGAEPGTLALMYNIIRELIALLCAPLLFRYFGPLAPISIGGATTGDTTLPVIAKVCGEKHIPLSIYHGLTVDFTVPLLVSFFCSL